MRIAKLARDYSRLMENIPNLKKDESISIANKTLLEFRNAGSYLISSQDRDQLSAWCRNIGDVIYESTGVFPAVRIYPLEIEESIREAKEIKDIIERFEAFLSIIPNVSLEMKNQIIAEANNELSSFSKEDKEKYALQVLIEKMSKVSTNCPADFIIPHQIPPPPLDFKGREDEIKDILSNFEKGATITGLRGMGGVGKTALALVLANRIKDKFPDGQIFIDLRGTSCNPDLPALKPEEAMAHVLRAYEPTDRLPKNTNELRGLYHSVLANKRSLLLLDNASNAEQVEPLLPPAGCSVIITSRIKFALPGLAEKDLDILSPKDARDLLLAIAPRIGERSDELAKLCGFLPIALRHAASSLAEKKDLKVSEYEQRLKDKIARLELGKSSFSLSYDLLPSTRKKNWRRLSVFPEYFDRDAATAVLKMRPEASYEALSDLVRRSLVDFIPTEGSEEGRYKLHDLARLFAESCLTLDELVDIQQRHAYHYSKVLFLANNLYLNGETDLLKGIKLFDLEWTNIKFGQAWVKSAIRSKRFSKKDSMLLANMALSYANDGVYLLDLRLHPRDYIGWFETGLHAARMINYREGEGNYLGNLGLSYSHLGEPRKAIEFYEQALKISREIGDRRGEGADLGNLGNAYSHLGEPRKAIEFYEQALKISREIGDRRGEGNHLGNLGNAYSHLGEPRKAIEFYEQALKISREIGDRRGEGNHLDNLGNAYSHLGEPRKAIELYEQALKISREIGDRGGEGNRLGNLGNAYSHLGEPRKAIEFYEQALKISREIGDRRGEGADLGNLGNAYSHLGEPLKAFEFHEQALKISREIGDRRNEGAYLDNLGLAYSHLGEPLKAINLYEQSLSVVREIKDRINESEILSDMGKVYLVLNEIDKTIDYCIKSLDLARNMECRRIEGEALCTLGKAFAAQGEPKKALEHCDQALEIFKDIEYPKGEAEALFARSQALYQLGRNEEATKCAQQALAIFQRIESRLAEKVRKQLAEWGTPSET